MNTFSPPLGFHVTLLYSEIKNYFSFGGFSCIRCWKLTFDNVSARRGPLFCYRARSNFQAFSLRDLKWWQEKPVAKVKRWAIALVFANLTVHTLEEAFISMCQSSWINTFISIAKLSNRCFCYVTTTMFVPVRRAQTWCLHTKLYKFGWRMKMKNEKQQRPDSWRGCLYCNHLSYPRFLNLFIEWLWLLVWSHDWWKPRTVLRQQSMTRSPFSRVITV